MSTAMKRADLDELTQRIRLVVDQSTLASVIRDVRLEEAVDEDDVPFIRVFLKVQGADDISWRAIAPLVRSVEDEVAAIDERFPSVRLAEAA